MRHRFEPTAMRVNVTILFTAVVVAAAFAAPVFGEIYRWQDANGQTVFSAEKPPHGTDATVVKINTAPPSSKSANETPQPPAADVKKKEPEKKVADAALNPTPAEMKANCAKSKEILTQLQNSNRLRYTQDNGELAYLTEEQRQQRIKDSQASVASWCKK
ncbi:MAG: DUF4124 domain-containing protein [Gammaproteobacteria bacterium]